MKHIMKIPVLLSAAAVFFSCGSTEYPHLDSGASALMSEMQKTVDDGKIMYGHEDALLYGHAWCSPDGPDYDRSDVKEVCGDHPAVLGLDLGGIEHGDSENLDLQAFDAVRAAAAAHFGRGGVVTFSWHVDNPLTGGDAWDVSSAEAVESILPGGQKHNEFMTWLSNLASFLDSLRDASGNRIPVIFRPWHEHTGSWFWWGRDLCTAEQYKSLWIMTHDYLAGEKGLKNLIWAYSPNTGVDAEGYMERYPGDGYVDILGFDCYEFHDGNSPLEKSNEAYMEQLRTSLAFISELGKEHGKIIALTETGFEGIPFPQWWTEVLYPSIKDYPVAYALTWRNACDRPAHFYGPFKGAACEEDFIRFHNLEQIYFLRDIVE